MMIRLPGSILRKQTPVCISFVTAIYTPIRTYTTRYYTDSHEWVDIEGTNATVGITRHAQETLGDVVFVGLPSVGDSFVPRDAFAEVESVKATNDVYMPVGGCVTAVNDAVKDDPSMLNKSPEIEGWLIKVKDITIPDGLKDSESYEKFLNAD
eukprot:Tbor_TRINITY_DN6021_c3_g4::TRINITY_DN6021_c3_g4_i1::g.11149::m.11149/K02437/gcvH, GCSH; glycine cleavage system H protein